MTPDQRDELWWANPQLKQQLRSDPAAVLRDRGVNVPPDLPLPIVHEFVRVVWLLWAEGTILPLDRFSIDPSDEGLLFGRGVWESTRTMGGVPWLWPLHIGRLLRSAELLHIPVDPDRLPDGKQVSAYVRALTAQDVVVRLNVTAGRPGKTGLVWMSAAILPSAAPSLRLKTCRSPVAKGQAYLTLKTFHYANRMRLGQQATPPGFDTVLLLDADDNVLEAAHANLFVRLADGWATPTADGGLLPGTVRQFLLENAPMPIAAQTIPAARLSEVREAFVTNSNVGMVPVTQIDAHTFPIGDDTRKLMAWLQPPPAPGPQYRFAERAAPLR